MKKKNYNKKKNRHLKKRKLLAVKIILIMMLTTMSILAIVDYFLNQINFIDEDMSYQNSYSEKTDSFSNDNVINILITGSDSRAGESNGYTDTIIILSINKENSTIVMTSIMRDLIFDIPKYGRDKINAAVPFGGHLLLLETIYDNLGIDVKKYIAIDFYSFIKIVDAINGITIDIDQTEIAACNACIQELNILDGSNENDSLIESSGEQVVTGKQALGYSRIRMIGNADYERTSRQREVLTAIINKIQSMNIYELAKLVKVLLPEITTNLSKNDIISLTSLALDIKAYKIIQNRIPIEGENVHITDFTLDIRQFNELVYGK